MRCIIRWRSAVQARLRPPQLANLDALLESAARTIYFRRRQIEFPRRCRDVAEGVSQAPWLPLEDFLRAPQDFYNWAHTPREPRPIELPLRDMGRVAVLGAGFRETESVRCFTFHPIEEIAAWKPDTIAGPVSRLCALADSVRAGRHRLKSVKTGIIAFSGLKHGCLKQAQRDLLWRAFGVPVYEQFRGFGQELLAWECEAHEGLHVVDENAFFEMNRSELFVSCLGCREYALVRLGTELTGDLNPATCGCGDKSRRLQGLRALVKRPAHLEAFA